MRVLHVCSDFSGIEAPLFALNRLGIKYKHIFSCDNDSHCKQSILANFNPICFFDDIRDKKTRFDHFPPQGQIDIYVVGLPCQPYSGLTERNTLLEKETKIKGNSDLLKHVILTFRRLLPKIIIFENVALFQREPDYQLLINALKRSKYDVHSELLNSKDYGIPQLRKRVYIVAIARSVKKKTSTFNYPPPVIPKCRNIKTIAKSLSTNVTSDIPLNESYSFFLQKNKEKVPGHSFVNLCSATRHGTFPADKKHVGCLTTNCTGMYNLIQNRYATIDELLMLQGFDPKKFKQVVSTRQMTKQIGNSMTVNVLEAIFSSIFQYVQF